MNFFFFTVLVLLGAGALPSNAADISGFVRDKSNGESIPFVNIYLKGQKRGGTSNESGYYAISAVPPGSYTLLASSVGYATFQYAVKLDTTDIILDILLREEIIELEATIVEGEREEGENFDISPGRTLLQVGELKSAPAAIEADPIRTIQTLPGVATLSDFSVGLYVRGGTPDQNLILLDGTDVYNASHLFGLFSTFPADAAKNVELLRGGYPAKYGGRLSSVLNVLTDEGNKENFETQGGISLLSSRLTTQGPVGKGSYLLSGRRTHLDPLLSIAEKRSEEIERLNYNFYDIQGKTHQVFSHADQLTLAAYSGQDNMLIRVFEFEGDLEWGNRTLSSKWTHIFASNLFGNFLITGSRFKAKTSFDTEDVRLLELNRLTDLSFKGDFTYYPNEAHTIEAGFLVKRMSMEYDFGESERSWFNINVDGWHHSVYAQDNWSASQRLTLQPGLRINYFSNGKYTGVSPRLAARYRLTPNTYLKTAVGRYHQYLFRLSREFQGISLLSNVWALADASAVPSKAMHYIAGLETKFADLDFDVEIYYKDYWEIYEINYDEQESTRIADILRRGAGQAYGFDLLLKKRAGKHTGWLSFSTGLSERTIAGLNMDESGRERPFKSKFDRRLGLNLIHSWSFARNWTLNCRAVYTSGQPYTQVLGRGEIVIPSGDRLYFEEKGPLNGVRLPSYQRLDMALQWQRIFRTWELKFYLQLINATNRENLFNYYWTSGASDQQKPGRRKGLSMLPVLPSLGLDFSF